MALTVTQNFIDAFVTKKTVEVRFHVEIWTATGTSTEWTDGPSEITDAQPTIAYVGALASTLDPINRSGGMVEQVELRLHDDPWNRAFIVANPLLKSKVTIKIGERSLAEGDYAAYFTGWVADAMRKKGYIQIICKSFDDALRRRSEQTDVLNKHPLEAIEEYCVGLESSQYDATSLDPSDSDYSSISHFVIGRGNYWLANEQANSTIEVNHREIVDELCQMLHGSFLALEDGVLTFRLFDPSTAIAASWTDEDMDECELQSCLVGMVNRLSIRCFEGVLGSAHQRQIDDLSLVVRRGDTASQGLFQHHTAAASDDVIDDLIIENRWLRGACSVFATTNIATGNDWSNVDPAVSDDIILYTHAYAFCGSRWPSFPGTAQPLWAQAGASNPVYLQLDQEIIKCTSVTISELDYANSYTQATVPGAFPAGAFTSTGLPVVGNFTIAERGSFGGSPAAHTVDLFQKPLYDVTIPMWTADRLLDRCSNGLPILKVSTSLAQYELQVGDMVGITTDRVSFYDHATLTTVTKWEVISKTVDPYANPPRIDWLLAFGSDSGTPSVVDSYECIIRWPISLAAGQQVAGLSQAGGQWYFGSGFELTNTNLSVTISAGKAYGPTGIAQLFNDFTFTATAEKEIVINFDCQGKSIVTHEIEIGGSDPGWYDITDRELQLYRIVTDTLTVVEVTDLRRSEPVPGSTIQTATAGTLAQNTDQFFADGIPNGALNIYSRDVDSYGPDNWTLCRDAISTDPGYFNDTSVTDTDTYQFSAANPVADTLSFTPVAPTYGNDGGLIMAIAYSEAETITSITQANVVWDQIGFSQDSGRTVAVWRGIYSGGTPATSYSIAASGTITGCLVVAEFDHITTGAVTAQNDSDTSETAESGSAITVSASREMLIAAITQDDNGGTFTWGKGFAEAETEQGAATQSLSLGYRQVNAGTYNAEATLDSSDDWAMSFIRVPLTAAVWPYNIIEDTDLWAGTALTAGKISRGTDAVTGTYTLTLYCNTTGNLGDKLWVISALVPVRTSTIYEIFGSTRRSVDANSYMSEPLLLYYDSSKNLIGASASSVTWNTSAGSGWFPYKAYDVPASAAYAAYLFGGKNLDASDLLAVGIDRVKVTTHSIELMAYQAGAQLIGTGAGWTQVNLDTANRDPASSFDTGNYWFTAPVTGYYNLSAQVEIQGLESGSYAECRIRNTTAAATIVTGNRVYNSTGGGITIRTAAGMNSVGLSAGDVVELQVQHTNAVAAASVGQGADVTFLSVIQIQGE